MQFLANLQRSTRLLAGGERRPPQNLQELADEIRHHPGSQSAHSCALWAQHLQWHWRDQEARMAQARGQSRRLWLEQSLVYQDLIASLEEAARQMKEGARPQPEELEELIEEFAQAARDMQAWSESDHARCLACGWDGEQASCPHCHKQLLKPVRQVKPANLRVPLAPIQGQVFDAVVAVLEGRDDLDSLWEPLQELHQDYCEANQRMALVAHEPEAAVVAEILERALDGLEEMSQVFQDLDTQHLEDGWHRFFQSEQSLAIYFREEQPDEVTFDWQEV